jgi:hypothetical protein
MDPVAILRQEKTELLNQIAQAAQEGKSDVVLAASERLTKVESLIKRHEQLILEIAELHSKKVNARTPAAPEGSPWRPLENLTLHLGGKTPREYGREIREAFLERLAKGGIHLQPAKGSSIYSTKSGQRVGIAVATERQPDRWFLGLPMGGFDHAVLLCRRDKGDIIEMLLPRTFFEQYGSRMSQSKGQVKFNIARRGTGYAVQVPGTEGVSVSGFSSDYSFLQ